MSPTGWRAWCEREHFTLGATVFISRNEQGVRLGLGPWSFVVKYVWA